MDEISSTVLQQMLKFVMKMRLSLVLLLGVSSLFLTACEAGIYHTVKPGQTLYRISRTYAVNDAYLARVNGISDPSQIPIGTRLFIPGAERVLSVPIVKPTVPGKIATVSRQKKVVGTPRQNPVTKTAKPKISKPKISQSKIVKTTATQVNKLQWPLRGKIVRSFSQKAKAGGGKGIEIAVRAGSDVTAAEAGKVIYSGDGVNGYAFLIILQHESDLFTVYGFNQKNLVRQGDFVSKGERIALSGTPPAGGKPRLHFEVRKGKLAVNPLSYLP